MRLFLAACLFGACCASLSSTGLLNAHQYLENLEEARGRRMTQAEVKKDFRQLIDKLHASGNDPKDEHFPPVRKIGLVRNFVKSIGPVLGKHGYESDAPLHQVIERVNDILVGAVSSPWPAFNAGASSLMNASFIPALFPYSANA